MNDSALTFNAKLSYDDSYYYVDAAGSYVETFGKGTYRKVAGAAPAPPAALTDLTGASVTAAAQKYTGKALTPAPQVSVQGTVINPASYKVAYKNNVNAGTATITVTGIESEGVTGTAGGTFRIAPKAITPAVSLSAASFVYNGKVRKPAVTVKDGSVVLAASNYTVSFSSGCKAAGSYKATVTLKGNYSGSRAVSFTIVPKGTKIGKLTAAKKAITVKWTRQATQTTGYQIQYALKSNFKGAKTVTVKGAKKVSRKITGLKAKKKYYVRIRTYKTVGGKKYYSAWSAKKSVKTK